MSLFKSYSLSEVTLISLVGWGTNANKTVFSFIFTSLQERKKSHIVDESPTKYATKTSSIRLPGNNESRLEARSSGFNTKTF